jgi:hypothetical protein
MNKCRTLLAMGISALSLTACANHPEIPYDHASAGDVKTIGLVTPSTPKEASVVLATSVGKNLPGALGIIGALVDGGLESTRETHFNSLLQNQHFSAQDALAQSLTKELEAKGYTVVMVPATREKPDFLTNYPTNTNVDAYLDVVTTWYGYVAAGVKDETPYRPGMNIKVKLVAAKNASILMQDVIAYNPINTPKDTVTIAPDPDYVFLDFDTLMGAPEKATQGLQVAATQSAINVGQLLK